MDYMNDNPHTRVSMQFQPESIACACLCIAASMLELPLPSGPPWFLLFIATEEEIEICFKIL